jgi:hypothetical protein
VVIATLVASTMNYVAILSYPVNVIVVVAVIAAAMALASSLGRWLLALLAVAAWPYFLPPLSFAPWVFYLPHGLGAAGQAYLVPAAVLARQVAQPRVRATISGPVLGPAALGGSAMLATDATLAKLGLTDPRSWDATTWLSDAGPHLAFGIVTYSALAAMTRR